MRFQGKTAIITGAANGIGLAAAERLCEEGANVLMADFDENAGIAEEKRLKEKGYSVAFVRTDVADRESTDRMVNAALEAFGAVDILVNNAGITRDAMLRKMDPSDFQQVLNVNITGVFNCTQSILPAMLEKGSGKIINTSSVSGVYGNVGQTNYAAAKAAVIGMTKTWAKELGRKGINVNAVAPGFTRTKMVEKMPENVISQMESAVALQRLGTPRDIANVYLFLASADADYVHGHVLHVDGGITM